MRTLRSAVSISFLTVGLVVLAVPMLLVPGDSRSEYFWHRVLWTEFLALLVWGTLCGFVYTSVSGDRARLGGILPALVMVVMAFAGTSFLLMLLHGWLPSGAWLDRLYLACQIVRFGLLVIVVALLFFSQAGAQAGADPLPGDLASPRGLASQLRRAYQHLESAGLPGAARDLRSLSEKIEYGLAHVGVIGGKAAYRELAHEVRSLSDEILGIGQASPELARDETALCERARRLALSVDDLVLALRR